MVNIPHINSFSDFIWKEKIMVVVEDNLETIYADRWYSHAIIQHAHSHLLVGDNMAFYAVYNRHNVLFGMFRFPSAAFEVVLLDKYFKEQDEFDTRIPYLYFGVDNFTVRKRFDSVSIWQEKKQVLHSKKIYAVIVDGCIAFWLFVPRTLSVIRYHLDNG